MSAQIRMRQHNFAQREPPQSLHNGNDMIIGLSQQFEHDRGTTNFIKVLRPGLLLALIALGN